MIHINPLYLFSHVVFIDIEKKFISIDKSIYHQIHALIFRGGRSSPKQRKLMRDLFYDTYYNHMYKGKSVNVEKFNVRLYNIYKRVEIRNIDMTTVAVDHDNDIILTDDKPYFVEENDYLDKDDVVIDPDVEKSLTRFQNGKFKKISSEDVNMELNLALVKTKIYNDFVDYLGYNRCINILRNFIFYDHYRLRDKVEFEFLRISLSFIAKYRMSYFNRQFDFICGFCNFVGTHEFSRIDNRKCSHSKWFSKDGLLDLNYGDTDYNSNTPFLNNSITTYAGLKYFRFGYICCDKNSVHSYHELVNANNNIMELEKLCTMIDNIGLDNMRMALLYREEILKINKLRVWLKDNYFDITWSSVFGDLNNLYLYILSGQKTPVLDVFSNR